MLEYAKSNNIYVSFDPNYRDALITANKLEKFIEDSIFFLKQSDFTKLSDEELFLLTGEKDITVGVDILHDLGAKVLTITLGSRGTYLSVKKKNIIFHPLKLNR